MAVAGGVIIQTLRGLTSVEKAASSGEPQWCFAWQDGRITVGKVMVWPEPRRAPVFKVFLDDNTTFLATCDQLVVRRDGGLCALTPPLEVSCMPLYSGRTPHGYPTYLQMGSHRKKALAPCDRRRDRMVARMVYEWKSGERIKMGMTVRHRDKDRTNCEPENLYLVGKPLKRGRKSKKRPPVEERVMMLRASEILKVKNNHRILAVRKFGEKEVYDLDTAFPGCFNVGAGGIFLVTKDDQNGTS